MRSVCLSQLGVRLTWLELETFVHSSAEAQGFYIAENTMVSHGYCHQIGTFIINRAEWNNVLITIFDRLTPNGYTTSYN